MTEASDPKNTPSWKDSYNAVRNPMRDVQSAQDVATAIGSAEVTIDGQKYQVKKDNAGRSITPITGGATTDNQSDA